MVPAVRVDSVSRPDRLRDGKFALRCPLYMSCRVFEKHRNLLCRSFCMARQVQALFEQIVQQSVEVRYCVGADGT
eukprot:1081741-Prymnesium_polylepis.2